MNLITLKPILYPINITDRFPGNMLIPKGELLPLLSELNDRVISEYKDDSGKLHKIALFPGEYKLDSIL